MAKKGNRPNQTSKEYFQGLNITFFGLLMGQLIFTGVAYFVGSGDPMKEGDSLLAIFKIVVPVFMVAGFFGSSFVANRR